MAKITFNQNVDFCGFNLGNKNITYPLDQSDVLSVENATQNSLVYSFVNDILHEDNKIYGRYKSTALSKDKFVLYRQTINDNVKSYMATISNVTDGFYDYNIENNQKYKYTVETNPTNTNGDVSSVSLETDYYVNPHWNYWSICDIEKDYDASVDSQKDIYVPSDTVFIMKNNLNIGTISDNLNLIKYNTLGNFGKVIQNSQKYDSGNISCLIADFIGYQDIKCGNNVFVIDDVTNEYDIDLFFIHLNKTYVNAEQLFKQSYFIFPHVSQKYYKYDINCAKVVYVLMSTCPDNWEESFGQYYTLDNESNQYTQVTHTYKCISSKPYNWDEVYQTYYVPLDDDTYIINTNSEWIPEYYYEKTVPIWQNNKYYIQAISTGTLVNESVILMNTYDMLNTWRDCLSNGKLKLLKAPNGQSWVVSISESTQLNISWQSQKYPASIDFSWQEVLDKNKISIIKW